MKTRYILVDDNPSVLSSVKEKIDTIANDYDLQYVASYHSSKKASEDIDPSSYDLLIVDYEMPVYNGVELAKRIAQDKKIVFLTSTTNNEKNVINNLDISGYLSKPFELEEFEIILKNKIIGKLNLKPMLSQDTYVSISVGTNKDIGFYPKNIIYISTSRNREGEQPKKNCVHIYGENDIPLFKDVRCSISELSECLSVYNFEKISQQIIINLAHLKERDNRYIKLYNSNESFEITEKEKKGFVARFKSIFGL